VLFRSRRALSLDGPWPMDVIRRGRGRMLEVQMAGAVLDCKPRVMIEQGVADLAVWVREQGGVEAVARFGRTPATKADATAQRSVADAAESDGRAR